MHSQLQLAARELFPDQGGNVRNIKFFLGSARNISADQLAQQILSADAQIASGSIQPVENIDD